MLLFFILYATGRTLFDLPRIEFQYLLQIAIVLILTLLALVSGHRTNAIKADQLAQQKSLNQAISRFVPNEFLAALGKTNITEIKLGDSMQKEVTVFFSDIRSYTSLSAQMTTISSNHDFI